MCDSWSLQIVMHLPGKCHDFTHFYSKWEWKVEISFSFFFSFTEKEALQSFGLETVECFELFGNLEIKLSSVAKVCWTISFWLDLYFPRLLPGSVVVARITWSLAGGTLEEFCFPIVQYSQDIVGSKFFFLCYSSHRKMRTQ